PRGLPELPAAHRGLSAAPRRDDRRTFRCPAATVERILLVSVMRAAVLHGVNDLRVEEVPMPTPGPGEVLVRVAVCGVCGSAATEYSRGPVLTVMPVTLGHEFVGTVEAVGQGVTSPAVGATVVCG